MAIYLASPNGVKYSVEQVKKGHLYYPGNHLYDIVTQAKKQGVPVHTIATYPGLLDFAISNEAKQWQKEIQLILQGG